MSHLPSYAYPGFGEWARKIMSYSEAVRIGDRIICSGQGGWDHRQEDFDLSNIITKDLMGEIDQENVNQMLKHAGR